MDQKQTAGPLLERAGQLQVLLRIRFIFKMPLNSNRSNPWSKALIILFAYGSFSPRVCLALRIQVSIAVALHSAAPHKNGVTGLMSLNQNVTLSYLSILLFHKVSVLYLALDVY